MVVTGAIGSAKGNTEWFFSYYDIFVRNAFGNYRDILREISFNPLMAENLSFLQSKSSAYLWDSNVKAQADENFAREIMVSRISSLLISYVCVWCLYCKVPGIVDATQTVLEETLTTSCLSRTIFTLNIWLNQIIKNVSLNYFTPICIPLNTCTKLLVTATVLHRNPQAQHGRIAPTPQQPTATNIHQR